MMWLAAWLVAMIYLLAVWSVGGQRAAYLATALLLLAVMLVMVYLAAGHMLHRWDVDAQLHSVRRWEDRASEFMMGRCEGAGDASERALCDYGSEVQRLQDTDR